MAVLGDSISQGQSSGGPTWSDTFQFWLNAHFPCRGRHVVRNKARSASATKFVLENFYEMFRTDKIAYDVVISSYLNDAHIEPEKQAIHAEALIRALLQLDSQPMVMFTDVGWKNGGSKPPYFRTTDLGPRDKVLFYYQIPAVSVFRTLFPIHMYSHVMQQNESMWPCYHWSPTDKMHTHPQQEGHKFIALLVAYTFYVEQQQRQAHPGEVEMFEFGPSEGLFPLTEAMLLSEEDQAKYALFNEQPLISLDFSASTLSPDAEERVHFGGDWVHKAETKKQKWGLVGTQASSMLSVKIMIERFVTVEYLWTYENIGSVAVWFDDLKDGGGAVNCSNLTMIMRPIPYFTREMWWNPSGAGSGFHHKCATNGTEYGMINGMRSSNDDRFSTVKSQMIAVEQVFGPSNETLSQEKWIHFCLPKDEKFKVLSLSSI